MTKVKICGLMELSHVNAAIEAGADAIGFVFAPSRRRVSIEQAALLAAKIPPGVLKIGVFVNADWEDIERAYREVPLDFIQFHGKETKEEIRKIGLPSIKAVSVKTGEELNGIADGLDADYFLLDAPGGGTGQTFDWSLGKGNVPSSRLILAGGLHEGNVQEAIRLFRPAMVDVSSGVEKDGRKDETLIREFIRRAKEEER